MFTTTRVNLEVRSDGDQELSCQSIVKIVKSVACHHREHAMQWTGWGYCTIRLEAPYIKFWYIDWYIYWSVGWLIGLTLFFISLSWPHPPWSWWQGCRKSSSMEKNPKLIILGAHQENSVCPHRFEAETSFKLCCIANGFIRSVSHFSLLQNAPK